MILHCTHKLLHDLGFKPKDVPDALSSRPLLSWHANVFRVLRQKVVVLVNDQTFFSIVLPGMKKVYYADFPNIVRLCLQKTMISEGYPIEYVNFLMAESGITYARTCNRQVISVMNDLVRHYTCDFEDAGSCDSNIVTWTQQRTNRIPFLAGTRKSWFPIERLAADIKAQLQ